MKRAILITDDREYEERFSRNGGKYRFFTEIVFANKRWWMRRDSTCEMTADSGWFVVSRKGVENAIKEANSEKMISSSIIRTDFMTEEELKEAIKEAGLYELDNADMENIVFEGEEVI